MKTKVTHLTSAHPRYDTRIFIKMCSSLAKKVNYKVSLVVADGKGDETKNGVDIVDVGAKSDGRISRMTTTVKKVFEKAKELDSDIYHLHDPELIPLGLKLKKLGKRVVFDAHEDVPKQLLAKHYLKYGTKKLISKLYQIYEKHYLKQLDFIVAATPIIRDKFLQYGCKSIDINNYPIIEEFYLNNIPKNEHQVVYIGTLYETRGIREIVESLKYVENVKLVLAGTFFSASFESELRALRGWNKVDFRGFVGREEISRLLQSSILGLVTLHPTPSYIESLPVKMFEYMSAGIPVLASDFPYWRVIIEKARCGLCVDPLNPKEIATSIQSIIDDPQKALEMGNNGRQAVEKYYNWGNEERKLYKVYEEIKI